MNQLTNKLLAYNLSGPGIQTSGGTDSVTKMESIISAVLGFLTIIGIIFFVVQIILAGFNLISSKGDPKEFQQSLTKLVHNLIGLLIVVAAYGVTVFLTNILGLNNVFDLRNSLPTVNK